MEPSISGFTRQETMLLTGASSSRLSYLEKAQIVVPTRIGKGRHPIVLFSFAQLVVIVALKERGEIQPKIARRIAAFLTQTTSSKTSWDDWLIILDDDIFWDQPGFPRLQAQIEELAIVGTQLARQFDLTVVPTIGHFVDALFAKAQRSPAIDFEDFQRRAGARL